MCFSRHFDRWTTAVRLLLLAIILATPGAAQAAANGCIYGQASVVSVEIDHDQGSPGNCHQSPASDARGGHSHDGTTGHGPGCDMGATCAAPAVLSAGASDSRPFLSAGVLASARAPAYPSLNLIPDYPPPRA